MQRYCVVVACISLVGCGGGGAKPDPTTTSVTVTVQSPLRMGQTTQATGTAVQSNGQSQSLASGWLSDATTVAAVTGTGAVTGVANGRATIYIVSGGRQGQQLVRVTPDYHGGWEGGLRVVSCTDTGSLADVDACDSFPVNQVYLYTLSLNQSGESLSAKASYGSPFNFPEVTAPIGADGTSSFTSSGLFTEDDVTFSVEIAFHLNSNVVGQLTGRVEEVWRLPNIPGELRLAEEIVQTNRTSVSPLENASGPSAKLAVLRRLRR